MTISLLDRVDELENAASAPGTDPHQASRMRHEAFGLRVKAEESRTLAPGESVDGVMPIEPNQADLQTLDRFMKAKNPETGKPWFLENSESGSEIRHAIEAWRTAIYSGERLDSETVRDADLAIAEAQAAHARRVAEKNAKDLATFRASK